MFTGIVEAVGTILAITPKGEDVTIKVDAGKLDMSDVHLGDSIATNGVCLTVVEFDQRSYSADLSLETLKRTGFSQYQVGESVNLEKAMLPSTRFGGHIVSGHVDDVGVIVDRQPIGRAMEYWIEVPTHLSRYIAEKGSITIDGVSLTVNSLSDTTFRLTIVPHTADETIIAGYQVGTKVNVEVDVMARYIERLLTKKTSANPAVSGVTHDLLAKSGFIK